MFKYIFVMLFISPLGNYINLEKTTPIRGSFTLNERPGKWIQIKTLRYIPGVGWINKIGLRNQALTCCIHIKKVK